MTTKAALLAAAAAATAYASALVAADADFDATDAATDAAVALDEAATVALEAVWTDEGADAGDEPETRLSRLAGAAHLATLAACDEGGKAEDAELAARLFELAAAAAA